MLNFCDFIQVLYLPQITTLKSLEYMNRARENFGLFGLLGGGGWGRGAKVMLPTPCKIIWGLVPGLLPQLPAPVLI